MLYRNAIFLSWMPSPTKRKPPAPCDAGDPGLNDPEQVESYTCKYRRQGREMQGLVEAGCANMVLTERPQTGATERDRQQEHITPTHAQSKT